MTVYHNGACNARSDRRGEEAEAHTSAKNSSSEDAREQHASTALGVALRCHRDTNLGKTPSRFICHVSQVLRTPLTAKHAFSHCMNVIFAALLSGEKASPVRRHRAGGRSTPCVARIARRPRRAPALPAPLPERRWCRGQASSAAPQLVHEFPRSSAPAGERRKAELASGVPAAFDTGIESKIFDRQGRAAGLSLQSTSARHRPWCGKSMLF